MLRHTLCALALSFSCSAAWAQSEDFQSWNAALLTIPTKNERISVVIDTQARFSDDASHLGQTLFRPSVAYKLDKTTSVSFGYAYFNTDPIGPAQSEEHRLWQQAAYTLLKTEDGLTITGRSRLEQRVLKGSDGIAHRLRQQVRITKPIAKNITGVAWSEAFIGLNETSWGQKKGYDRWRNFVGVSIPLGKSMTVEPGYMQQWVNLPKDRIHNIASLTLTKRF